MVRTMHLRPESRNALLHGVLCSGPFAPQHKVGTGGVAQNLQNEEKKHQCPGGMFSSTDREDTMETTEETKRKTAEENTHNSRLHEAFASRGFRPRRETHSLQQCKFLTERECCSTRKQKRN